MVILSYLGVHLGMQKDFGQTYVKNFVIVSVSLFFTLVYTFSSLF